MPLTDQFAPGTQIRAAFCSEANFSHWADPRGTELEIGRILHPAPHTEHIDQLGGIFYSGNRYYLQVIEGPVESVEWYLAHTESDDRHQNFKTLTAVAIDQPSFKPGYVRFVGTGEELRAIQERLGERVFNPYLYDEDMIQSFVELAGP